MISLQSDTGEQAFLIREYQAGGRMVAMDGRRTNDAPALPRQTLL